MREEAIEIAPADAVLFLGEKEDDAFSYFLTDWCLLVVLEKRITRCVVFDGEHGWLYHHAIEFRESLVAPIR